MKTYPIVNFVCACLSLSIGPVASAGENVAVSFDALWKYHVPTSDPGTSWRNAGFNDASWGQGNGLLGFETAALPAPGMGTTIVKTGTPVTYLFRKAFTWSAPVAGTTVTVDQIVDDGVIYYLNGQKIGAVGANETGAWNAVATRVVDNAVLENGVISAPASMLVTGTNVLAAEVHQAAPDSSDLVFGVRVKISTPPVSITPVKIEHVIAISVDGLRGDFLKTFIDQSDGLATASQEFPNFLKLRNASAHTYNARCDYHISDTSPNHVSMITGRSVAPRDGSDQTYHGYTINDWDTVSTIHDFPGTNPPGTYPPNPGIYKASIFDVAHDRGLSTALLISKEKLLVINTSYNEDNGAPDVTGPDNGKKKIDYQQFILNFPPDPDYFDSSSLIYGSTSTSNPNGTGAGVGLVALINNQQLKNFTLLHLTEPDIAGHSSSTIGGGWKTAPGKYRDSVKLMDTLIGAIMTALQNNAAYRNKVAIILTADHGGGYDGTDANPSITSHRRADRIENVKIPFFVSAPGFTPGSNLYDYFENRFDPGVARPTFATNQNQPLHNGDVANVSAALLGLPVVPGSTIRPQFRKTINATPAAGAVSISWPAYLTDFVLEATDSLSAPTWTTITTEITQVDGVKNYRPSTTGTTPPARFFRLRKP